MSDNQKYRQRLEERAAISDFIWLKINHYSLRWELLITKINYYHILIISGYKKCSLEAYSCWFGFKNNNGSTRLLFKLTVQ